MAVDYIIASILIVSALINSLALAGYWMTPDLRTATASRFVANLLIVNLLGCVILIPSLFVFGGTATVLSDTIPDSFTSKSIVGKIITENLTIENRVECMNRTVDGLNCSRWLIENDKQIVIEEVEESFETDDDDDDMGRHQRTRCWVFDLIIALGESMESSFCCVFFMECLWKFYF